MAYGYNRGMSPVERDDTYIEEIRERLLASRLEYADEIDKIQRRDIRTLRLRTAKDHLDAEKLKSACLGLDGPAPVQRMEIDLRFISPASPAPPEEPGR